MDDSLQAIDWDSDSYEIVDGVTMELSSHSTLSRDGFIREAASAFEDNTPYEYYVYCIKYEEDGNEHWYVGETENLTNRIATHSREKDIENIEYIEGAESRENARQREHDLHAEVILEQQSKNVWGGH